MKVCYQKPIGWFVRFTLFLFIFLLLFVWVSFLFRPPLHFRKNILGYYAEKNDTIDVTMIGASSTYVYWMPLEAFKNYGISSYNFAGDAMSPSLIKNSIIETRKSQKSLLYVIDVRSFINRENIPDYYKESYVRYYTDCIFYSKNRAEMINYAAKYENIKLNEEAYVDLIKYHSNWKSLNEDSFKFSLNCRKDDFKGFSLTAEYQPIIKNDYSNIISAESLSSENEQILSELLEYCKINKLNCLFTVSPYQLENKKSKMQYNYIRQRVQQLGYKFVDANEHYDDMKIDFFKDFYNINHVNVFGAEKYTSFLANYIINNYNLPDCRNDSQYLSWNDDYKIWHQQLSECKKNTNILYYTFVENLEKEESVTK